MSTFTTVINLTFGCDRFGIKNSVQFTDQNTFL